jgi:hypothetical protein
MSTTRARSALIAVGERATSKGCADPTACDADFAAAVEELQQAMEQYKQSSGRLFPTWCEVLEVLGGLRYRKVGHEAASPGRCGHGRDDPAWPPRR